MPTCEKCSAPNGNNSIHCWHCKAAIEDRFNRHLLHRFMHSRFADVLLFVCSVLCLLGAVIFAILFVSGSSVDERILTGSLAIVLVASAISSYRLQY